MAVMHTITEQQYDAATNTEGVLLEDGTKLFIEKNCKLAAIGAGLYREAHPNAPDRDPRQLSIDLQNGEIESFREALDVTRRLMERAGMSRDDMTNFIRANMTRIKLGAGFLSETGEYACHFEANNVSRDGEPKCALCAVLSGLVDMEERGFRFDITTDWDSGVVHYDVRLPDGSKIEAVEELSDEKTAVVFPFTTLLSRYSKLYVDALIEFLCAHATQEQADLLSYEFKTTTGCMIAMEAPPPVLRALSLLKTLSELGEGGSGIDANDLVQKGRQQIGEMHARIDAGLARVNQAVDEAIGRLHGITYTSRREGQKVFVDATYMSPTGIKTITEYVGAPTWGSRLWVGGGFDIRMNRVVDLLMSRLRLVTSPVN